MLIKLLVERADSNRLDLGDPAFFVVSCRWTAKLIFELPTATITFYQYADSPEEATLNAINSFLSGQDRELEVRYRTGLRYAGGIRFDSGVHPDIQDIILKAIDIKTGNDRNRLESDFREYA
jgi:hypothetical protein